MQKTPPRDELLVLCQLFYPELISTGQTLTELCESLSDRGVAIEVVCAPLTVVDRTSRVAPIIDYHGIKIRRVWSTRFPKLNLPGRIVNQLTFALATLLFLLRDKSSRPILVLTNPPFLAFACALLKALGRRRKIIYLVFDVYPDTAVQLGLLKTRGLITRLWNRINAFVWKHTDTTLVIGRCMQSIVEARMREAGIDPTGKVERIHIWADDRHIAKIPRDRNPFVEKWSLADKFTVGYFGNMGRFHDMETIVQAARILGDRQDIQFLFVGEGHKKRETQEQAAKWGLSNCRFETYVDRDQLPHSLSTADLGLVSLAPAQTGLSVPSKTFGLMAAGVPVVGIMHPDSEIARVLTEQKCGVVTAPGDADELARTIVALATDRERCTAMGQRGRQAIDRRYNLDRAAGATLQIVRSPEPVHAPATIPIRPAAEVVRWEPSLPKRAA